MNIIQHSLKTMNNIFITIMTRRPYAVVIFFVILFITFTAGIGMYADRQIINHRDASTMNQPLGNNILDYFHAYFHYDSHHYYKIVTDGYNELNAAFFPLYPLTVKAAIKIGAPIQYSFFIVSWLFCIASAVVIFYWASFELKKRKVKVSPWYVLFLLAIFPTSFYMTIGYSESLFVFLTVSSLFAYRKEKYLLSGLLIALATATRVQGGALAIFFLLDYVLAKKWKTEWIKLLPILMSIIGIGAYMFFQWKIFGDPFQFIETQKNWGRLNGNIFENLISSMRPPFLWYLPILGLMLYATLKEFGIKWFIFGLIFILIPISSGRLDSINRYMIGLPLLFLALAIWLSKRTDNTRLVYAMISFGLLIWDILLFTNDYWVA